MLNLFRRRILSPLLQMTYTLLLGMRLANMVYSIYLSIYIYIYMCVRKYTANKEREWNNKDIIITIHRAFPQIYVKSPYIFILYTYVSHPLSLGTYCIYIYIYILSLRRNHCEHRLYSCKNILQLSVIENWIFYISFSLNLLLNFFRRPKNWN